MFLQGGDQLKRSIMLFTASYPSLNSGERGFLDPEFGILASTFDRVILVPTAGCRTDFMNLPENVAVDNSFCKKSISKTRHFKSALWATQSRILLKELVNYPMVLCHPYALMKMIVAAGEAVRVRSLFRQFVLRNDIELDRTIFYTYWFGRTTLGITLYKRENPSLKLVSRAHRSDLYEDLYDPPYIPYRLHCLHYLDRLYLISQHGRDYMEARYPQFKEIYRVARLGVEAGDYQCPQSQDDTLRIVSCSYVKPVKRLDLLIQGLETLSRQHRAQKFHWTHIGGSEDQALWSQLGRRSNQLPANVSVTWTGQIRNRDVHDYYRKNAVDVFVNLSDSEGISVAMMEATNYGIPIVATGVGGTPEIVSQHNGRLLDENPDAVDVANAIWSVIGDKETNLLMRGAAFKLGRTSFSAKKNHRQFVESLLTLWD